MPIKKSELYSSLWKSCDELRGGMDASQYKDYVLVLLFVKYVSDKYAGQKDALLDVPKGGRFAEWGIKKMKTKWGACNAQARRVWLNLELAKKPVQCLEYLVVHELAHLIEQGHNDRFTAIMDKHLPSWRSRRQELNSAPLAHEAWSY